MPRRSRLAVLLLAVLILALGRGSDETPEHDQGDISETDTPEANPGSQADEVLPETLTRDASAFRDGDDLGPHAAGFGAEGLAALRRGMASVAKERSSNSDDAPASGSGDDTRAPPEEAAPMQDASPEKSSTGEASAGDAQLVQQDALLSGLRAVNAKNAQRAAVALLQEALQEHGVSLSSELLEVGRSLRTTRPVKAAVVLGLIAAFAGTAAEASGVAGAITSGIATAAAVELGHMRLLGEGVERSEAAAIELFQQAATYGDPDAQHALGVLYATGFGTASHQPLATTQCAAHTCHKKLHTQATTHTQVTHTYACSHSHGRTRTPVATCGGEEAGGGRGGRAAAAPKPVPSCHPTHAWTTYAHAGTTYTHDTSPMQVLLRCGGRLGGGAARRGLPPPAGGAHAQAVPEGSALLQPRRREGRGGRAAGQGLAAHREGRE